MRFLPALLATCLSAGAGAQQTFEVIPLRHSTAEQVLPALRPFLEPGGMLTGQYSQLVVRATPSNIAELRRVLESIDRPRRRLQVSVRFDDGSSVARRGFEARGRIGNGGAEAEIRAQDARRDSESRIDQRVQVLEGSRAVILFGQSRPQLVRERIQTPAGPVGQDALVVREAMSGFEVVPQLAGRTVQLAVAPQRERFADSTGAVDAQRVATTVTAPLGEWVEIGGAVSQALSNRSGMASAGSVRAAESRRIWVRVDEVAN
ncbi:MAG TPA: secretin N-terminal domain-containing protein [Burkholderiales bacterium]|nr:secretin N-terminal domain-containing protein [Burkholderiales bacterium]